VSSGLVLDVPEVPVPVPAEVPVWLPGWLRGVPVLVSPSPLVPDGSGDFGAGSWVVPLCGSAGSGVGSGLGSDISLPRPGCDPTQDT
jgi:hypothetical protein